ncbi:MAG: NAD(P)-dependent oxidoreductase [Hyphomicrobium sp.]|nr:NAD(P)-dependent oxidoreductase [Hyphomicrobium sp.]
MSNRPIGIVAADGSADSIAERIAATGQRVMIYRIDRGHHGKRSKNIEAASTATDIGFDCALVLSFIDDTTVFREFLIGTPEKTGLAAEMNPGAILVDFGVRPPRETQALLGVTGMRGVAILDAAFAATYNDRNAPAPSILLGGFPDSVDAAEPILSLIGKVDRTGPLGSAHTTAALMGYLEAAHHIAHDEALAVGHALGIPHDALQRHLDAPQTQMAAPNIVSMAARTRLVMKLAQDRGVAADVIDFTGTRLSQALSRRG